ncbi:MAG: methyltransferase domain-containing protein [Woeseiaceae bacterium]|jgi:predicted methyltransferase|nr:methyltransferase domain-containing protein [Woeseiaceae bacterium]
MRTFTLLFAVLGLVACQPAEQEPADSAAPAESETAAPVETAPLTLGEVLAAQPEEAQARYEWRHPQETLEFFGIEPGMTVVEALPGGGWYTKILLPYLGSDGTLIGAAYPLDLYALFPFANEEFMARQANWTTDFAAGAEAWRGDNGATVVATRFGSIPSEYDGEVDAVLMVRALHNMARFENAGEGPYLSSALADAYRVLKPGGVLGVVQHHARDDMPDTWASGANGYLKKQFVIDAATAAGFELAGDSDINANPADQPTTEDIVWRLPPGLLTSEDDPELRAELEAVGESNRMTLKFVKPE